MIPSYDFHFFVCQNQRPSDHPSGCCLSKGSDEILSYLKKRVKDLDLQNIRINKSGCLGQCHKGPAVVIYPEGTWYSLKTMQDAEEVIQKHLVGHQKVKNLQI